MHYQCSHEDQDLDHPTKKWCCTTSDCDADFKWGECPAGQDIAPDTHNCTNGYTSVDSGKNCYKAYTDKKTWADARTYCEKVDIGNLVSVTDQFEQAFVRVLTLSQTLGDPWIGLTTGNDGKSWQWTDSRRETYTNWGDIAGVTKLNEKCVYVQTTDGKWNLTTCDEQRPFICKISKEPLSPSPIVRPGYCDGDGWSEKNNKCYKAFNDYLSFAEAKVDCQKQRKLKINLSFLVL
jgi:hypothetical protein